MHLNISPLMPPDSVSPGSYTPFLSALYSVSVGSYTLFLPALFSVSVGSILRFSRLLLCFCASFTRFSYSSTHFLVWKCPFCPASRKVSSILRSSTFPTSFPLSFPRQSLRAIFFRVLPYLFHCALPSSFLPCSPLPHLVINRVLLPIPVLVGRLKAQ